MCGNHLATAEAGQPKDGPQLSQHSCVSQCVLSFTWDSSMAELAWLLFQQWPPDGPGRDLGLWLAPGMSAMLTETGKVHLEHGVDSHRSATFATDGLWASNITSQNGPQSGEYHSPWVCLGSPLLLLSLS
jgi:hypothetical protein